MYQDDKILISEGRHIDAKKEQRRETKLILAVFVLLAVIGTGMYLVAYSEIPDEVDKMTFVGP